MDVWDNLAKKHVIKSLRKNKIQNVFINNSLPNESWHIMHFPKIEKAEPTILVQVRGLDWLHCSEKFIDGRFSDNSWNVLCIVILYYSKAEPYLTYVIPKNRFKKSNSKYKLIDFNNVSFTKTGIIKLSDFDSEKEYFDKEFKNRWDYIDVAGKYYAVEKQTN